MSIENTGRHEKKHNMFAQFHIAPSPTNKTKKYKYAFLITRPRTLKNTITPLKTPFNISYL